MIIAGKFNQLENDGFKVEKPNLLNSVLDERQRNDDET